MIYFSYLILMELCMTDKIIDWLASAYKTLFVWLGIVLLFLELVGGIVLAAKFGVSFFSVLGTLVGTLLVWCSMSLLFKIVSSLQKIEASVCSKPLVIVSDGDSSSTSEANTEAKTDTDKN